MLLAACLVWLLLFCSELVHPLTYPVADLVSMCICCHWWGNVFGQVLVSLLLVGLCWPPQCICPADVSVNWQLKAKAVLPLVLLVLLCWGCSRKPFRGCPSRSQASRQTVWKDGILSGPASEAQWWNIHVDCKILLRTLVIMWLVLTH